ncbi:MAG: DUF3471 domain-containing protein, partial [Gemmatimonadaceae bacterium]
PMITHNGSWAGYTSFTVYFPKQHGAVVMLSNAGINADAAGIAVSNVFFAKDLAPEIPSATVAARATGVSVPNALLDEYAATYRLGPGWYVRIRRDGSALRVRATQEDEFPMTARSQQEFWVDAYGASVTFQRDSAKRISSIRYRGRNAPRMDDASERPLRIAEYAGDYESSELSVTYTVAVRDTALVMRQFRRGTARLIHAFGDEFTSTMGAAIAFERDASGRVTGFTANAGDRNRNVKFIRRP